MIYCSPAPHPAVTTGAYRAVEFIKANSSWRRRKSLNKPTAESSRNLYSVRAEGDAEYLYCGVFRYFGVAFVEPASSLGYLISIATFGLYQAIFMANAERLG